MGIITLQIQYDGPLTPAQVKKRVRELLGAASVKVQPAAPPIRKPTKEDAALRALEVFDKAVQQKSNGQPDTMTDEEIVADVREVRHQRYLDRTTRGR